MNDFDIIMDGFKNYVNNLPVYQDAIESMKCSICGMILLQKGDWIFCPKHTNDIPECDSLYHIAKNIKTGRGWNTI